MIKFKDFGIQVTKNETWFVDPEFEDINETLLNMNYWIEEYDISVLNIETLFVPNMHKAISKGKTEDSYYTVQSGESKNTKWFQTFRVWYQDLPNKNEA